MKHVETEHNGIEIIMERFNNYTEFLNIIRSRETLWTVNDEPVHEIVNENYWRGCSSYDEAEHYLQYGYEGDLERMKSRVGELQKQGTRMKTRQFNDVVGFAPIVANALMGIPNAMINSERKPVASKCVTICYEPSVSSMGTEKEVFEFGCRFVNAVMNLEEHGIRVRIDYLKTNSRDGRCYAMRIPVKNENQPINLKRLMFPLTHIAMQRYLSFEWLETLPNSKHMFGYGHALYGATPQERKAITETIIGDNEYLIHFDGSDIEDVLKQIDSEK